MGIKIYINGEYVDKKDAKVSVFDHGLLYGDGIFEGIRCYAGTVFKLKEHIVRLYRSAKAIRMIIPISEQEMIDAVEETLKVNGLVDAYIRLVVTRGVGDLGLDPDLCENPTIIIIADKIALYPKELYAKGLRIISVPTPRVPNECINPQVKSLNYLNNILAKIEGKAAGVKEVMMLNNHGFVCECSADNIFMVKDNEIYTPPVSAGILRGITRDTVIEIAGELGYKLHETNLSRYDFYTADEAFITGSGAEIIGLVEIDSRTIGDGKPGPVTQRVLARYKELTGMK